MRCERKKPRRVIEWVKLLRNSALVDLPPLKTHHATYFFGLDTEGEVQMTGKFLIPLWKRGIKGDLLEWRGGFLGRRAADFFEALNQGRRK